MAPKVFGETPEQKMQAMTKNMSTPAYNLAELSKRNKVMTIDIKNLPNFSSGNNSQLKNAFYVKIEDGAMVNRGSSPNLQNLRREYQSSQIQSNNPGGRSVFTRSKKSNDKSPFHQRYNKK